MLKNMPTLEVVLIIIMMTTWMGIFAPPTFAQRARVPQTGQTECWDAVGSPITCTGRTGQDGDIQAGVEWPTPRFTNRGNGTVRDNLTGLIWLRDASCDALGQNGAGTWQQALDAANALASGQCGLADGSRVGHWRLPNIKELYSLFDLAFFEPAISNATGTVRWMDGDAFVGLQPVTSYWSATTVVQSPAFAWYIFPGTASILATGKGERLFVWSVRGGD